MLAKLVLLNYVVKKQDRCLIRNPVTNQLDGRKATHGGQINQKVFIC